MGIRVSEQHIALPASARSAAQARRFVARALAGTSAAGCGDVAVLLSSELVTNAVLHAQSPVDVHVVVRGSTVRVEVHDRDEHLPHVHAGPGETLAGRGLHIVDGLARRWGATPTPTGKAVWFELTGCAPA
jgi:anti-sigma regulatory factor (Ser/Thr protein kinase)